MKKVMGRRLATVVKRHSAAWLARAFDTPRRRRRPWRCWRPDRAAAAHHFLQYVMYRDAAMLRLVVSSTRSGSTCG